MSGGGPRRRRWRSKTRLIWSGRTTSRLSRMTCSKQHPAQTGALEPSGSARTRRAVLDQVVAVAERPGSSAVNGRRTARWPATYVAARRARSAQLGRRVGPPPVIRRRQWRAVVQDGEHDHRLRGSSRAASSLHDRGRALAPAGWTSEQILQRARRRTSFVHAVEADAIDQPR